jgi:hypothetical protein
MLKMIKDLMCVEDEISQVISHMDHLIHEIKGLGRQSVGPVISSSRLKIMEHRLQGTLAQWPELGLDMPLDQTMGPAGGHGFKSG